MLNGARCGVFTRDAQQRVLFRPAHEPDAAELESIARGVHRRVMAWLARHGYVDGRPAEDRSNEPPEPGALEACAAIAMQRGAFAKLSSDEDHGPDDAQERAAGKMRFAVEHEGFNLHGGVRIAAGNDLGRERLARYGARRALALDRLRRLPGGRVAYRVKCARLGAAKHRVMTSLELMARLGRWYRPHVIRSCGFTGCSGLARAGGATWCRGRRPRRPHASGSRRRRGAMASRPPRAPRRAPIRALLERLPGKRPPARRSRRPRQPRPGRKSDLPHAR